MASINPCRPFKARAPAATRTPATSSRVGKGRPWRELQALLSSPLAMRVWTGRLSRPSLSFPVLVAPCGSCAMAAIVCGRQENGVAGRRGSRL